MYLIVVCRYLLEERVIDLLFNVQHYSLEVSCDVSHVLHKAFHRFVLVSHHLVVSLAICHYVLSHYYYEHPENFLLALLWP